MLTLQAVILPDFTAPDVFDSIVQGVDYIIHCASPIPMGQPTTMDPEHEFIRPAVDATVGLLRSASKAAHVKRVVVTSSCAAIAPVEAALVDTGETYTADTRQPTIDTSQLQAGISSFVAYAAGKVTALNAAEAWMEKNNPHFDVIHLMPSYVLGRVGMARSVSDLRATANNWLLNVLVGREVGSTDPTAMAMIVNHVDDCARIHVEALRLGVGGNQNFMISYDNKEGFLWNDAAAVVTKHFPDAIADGRLPCTGRVESVGCDLDNKKTQQNFGFKYTCENAVRDFAEQYLELLAKQEDTIVA